MITASWQLPTPIDAFIFDCDGTLSQIEGIDELAIENQVGAAVAAMTAQAMGQTGINPNIYQKRLDLVRPTQEQVLQLGKNYFAQRAPEVVETIALLQRLQKTVYIISAGLSPAVALFGERLKVPLKNIFAVNISFDAQGRYLDFEHSSPLVTTEGKRIVVNQLKKQHSRIMHIGDGLNDFAVYDLVTRFVGYGGAYYRENIANRCEFYIKTLSMAPLLPLALTGAECGKLKPGEKTLYEMGLEAIEKKQVIIRSPSL